MQIYHSLESFLRRSPPIVLTIGNFDGIHLGHQAVLNRLDQIKNESHLKSAVITFANHPAEVLQNKKIPKILTPAHKIKLFEQFNLDFLFLLPFTLELSELSAQAFIEQLLSKLPLQFLLLGHDSTLGKNRHGNRDLVLQLASEKGIQCEYVEPFLIEQERVSSSLVKELIRQGQLAQLKIYLGRPYSILSEVTAGRGKGKVLGYPTANLKVDDLTLPPYGVYAIHALCNGQKVKGIANLGVAPTVREASAPVLEAYLFDVQEDFYGQEMEVIFESFIRPEFKFNNIAALQKQIATDIEQAHKLLSD